MNLKDIKTKNTFLIVATVFTVYSSGVFFAREHHNRKLLDETYSQRQKANSIIKQGETITEMMKYYTPENKILAHNTLDSLIKEKISIDNEISKKMLENDYSALKSWIYLFE